MLNLARHLRINYCYMHLSANPSKKSTIQAIGMSDKIHFTEMNHNLV